MIPRRRSQPEHVGVTARDMADAYLSAFGSGVVCTRAYIQKRASRPHTYLTGAIVEVLSSYGASSQRFEYAADAGGYVTDRMRRLEQTRDIGAEVRACVERPGKEPGSIVRETLVHRRLAKRADQSCEWEEVRPTPTLRTAETVSADMPEETDGES